MGGGKRSGRRSDKAKVDDSVPFAFLLGERYSGYKQAINSSKDLKVCVVPRRWLAAKYSRGDSTNVHDVHDDPCAPTLWLSIFYVVRALFEYMCDSSHICCVGYTELPPVLRPCLSCVATSEYL